LKSLDDVQLRAFEAVYYEAYVFDVAQRLAQQVVVIYENGERIEDALHQPHGQYGTADVLQEQ
jgi:hypothetical protein